jgi:hypothetical protein
MKLAPLGRIALAIAASSFVSQAALAAPVCEGEYMTAVNGTKSPVQGKVTGVTNPYRTQSVDVEVKDCGRTIVIHGDGAMSLKESVNAPGHYVGTAPGMTAVFDAWGPTRLTGQVLMPGSRGSVIYEMTLVNGHKPDMENCGTPDATAEMDDEDWIPIDPELRREAINIVADELGVPRDKADKYISAPRKAEKTRSWNDEPTVILPGEGDCPIEFKGVRNCLEFPPEVTTTVVTNVLMDEEGRLLPVKTDILSPGGVRVDGPEPADICSQEETPTIVADRRLRFKFHAGEEDGFNDVQTMLYDAETGKAEVSHYADGEYGGKRGRIEAANEAYEGVGAPVTGIK